MRNFKIVPSKMRNFILQVIFLCSCFPTLLNAQWLETTIPVSDSLSGISRPQTFIYNTTNNKIYVGGQYGNFVIVIDGTTNQKIARIQTGRYISDLCWNSQNNKIYCANGLSNNVTVIDGQTNAVITTINAGINPYALVWNSQNNKIYCANWGSNNVTVIDGQTNAVITTINVGGNPRALVWNSQNNKVYCVNNASNSVTVINGQTNAVITTITVGTYPWALVWNPQNNKVYCSNFHSSNITVIDGQTNAVITTITAGTYPRALVWNSQNNKVYCANFGSSNVTVINGQTNAVITTITLGGMPQDLVWNSQNNKIYCANQSEYGTITIIDGVNNTVITTINVGNHSMPSVLVWNSQNNKIYCANDWSDNITVINGQTNAVITTITLGNRPCALVWNSQNNKIYCANNAGNNVTVIDGQTNAVITTIPAGIYPDFLVWNSTNNRVFCANEYSHNITVIDGQTNAVITTIPVGSYPCALVWNSQNNKIYCANVGSNNITVIDGQTNTVITTISAGTYPCALVWNSQNNKIYCASWGSDNVTVIDGQTNSVITTIPVGTEPGALAWNSQDNKVYCANGNSHNVTVINGQTNAVITTITTGIYPSFLVWNSQNNKVYCANQGNDNITVIDGQTNVVITTIPVGDLPWTMVWNSQNNKVYCANDWSDNVTVIDGQTNSVITTITVGSGPQAFCWNSTQNRIYVANVFSNTVSVIRDINTQPQISIYPPNYDVVLQQNQVMDTSLTISNIGGSNLTWNLTISAQAGLISATPSSGTISPGNQTNVALRINNNWQNPAIYNCTLKIVSNAPDKSIRKVPVNININGPTPTTRIVKVINNTNPVPGCSVYVNGIPQQGLTDNQGILIVSNVRINDRVWAVKKVYIQPAVKGGHEAVDNTMFELWMDTKTLLPIGGGNWDWFPDIVSSTNGLINLDLRHPIFKWNLVISLEWNNPDNEWNQIQSILNEASNWLYNVTDGQMSLGKVAVYDAKQKWYPDADARVKAETWFRSQSSVAKYSRLFGTWIGFGIRGIYNEPSRADLASNVIFSDDRTIIHEFGHYALGFFDEYEDGNGNENFPWRHGDWNVFPPIPPHPDEFPSNYELMQWQYGDDVTEMSSWYYYLPRYDLGLFDGYKVTRQFWEWRKPCWEALKEGFERDYNGIKVRLLNISSNIQRPESSSLADKPNNINKRRKGPNTIIGCNETIFNTPGTNFNRPIYVKTSTGEYLANATVDVKNKYFLGTTSSQMDASWIYFGVLGVGLEIGNILTAQAKINGITYKKDFTIKSIEPQYEITLPSLYFDKSKNDNMPPTVVTDIQPTGDTISNTLNVFITTNESLATLPNVIVFPDGMDSIQVSMNYINNNFYSGLTSVGTSHTGLVHMSILDTVGNCNFSINRYCINPVFFDYSTMLYSSDGFLNFELPDSSLNTNTVCIYSCFAPTIIPNDSLEQVSDIYSIRASNGINNLNDSIILNIEYLEGNVNNTDENSLSVFRWNNNIRQWMNLGGLVMPEENRISVRVNALGIYAVFGVISNDTIQPSRINNLGLNLLNSGHQAKIIWNAPGDDGTIGQASAYDIRYHNDSITNINWDGCSQVQCEPHPGFAGNTDSFTISFANPDTTYYIAIKATDEASNVSGLSNVVSIYIQGPPAIPAVYLPTNLSYISDTTPKFVWTATLTDTGIYRLQYASNSDFLQDTVTIDSLITNTYTVPDSQALEEGTYYWQVCAIDKYGNTYSYQSPPYQFTIDISTPAQPALIKPTNNSWVNSVMPQFIWTASVGDWGHYSLQISADSVFADSQWLFRNIYDTTFTITESLTPLESTYYWRVKAINGTGNESNWSSIFRFEIDTGIPTAPTLVEPIQGVWQNDTNVVFNWTTVTFDKEKNEPQINTDKKNDIDIKTGNKKQEAEENVEQVVSLTLSKPNLFASPMRYLIQVDTNYNFTAPLLVDTTNTTCDTFNLSERKYFWRVRAYDLAGNQGSFSNPDSFGVDIVVPSIPMLISPANNAITNDSNVIFIWNRASDTLSGVTSYTLQYANNSEFTMSIDIIVSDTIRTIILTDTIYFWHVKAHDRAGNQSSWSSSRSFEVDTRVPNAPVPISPINGTWLTDSIVIFNWSQVTLDSKIEKSKDLKIEKSSNLESSNLSIDTYASLVRYILQVDTSRSFSHPIVDTSDLCYDTIILNQAQYYWRVRAYDLAGNQGSFSNPDSFGVDIVVPSIPMLISPANDTILTDSFVRFYWNHSTDNVSGVGNYQIQIAYNSNFTNPIDTLVSDTTIVRKLRDSTYYWVVRAIDRANNPSGYSPTRNFEVDTRIPIAPTLVSPINGVWDTTTSVVLNWSSVTSDTKSPVRYILQVATDTVFTSLITDTTSLVYDTLTLIQSRYYWRVRAYDLAGNQGAFSGRDSFGVDNTAPSIPILIYPPDSSSVRDTFIWHRASDNLSGIRYYQIHISHNISFTDTVLNTITTDTMFIFTLPPSVYYWHVRAIDRAGNNSLWSEIHNMSILEPEAPMINLPLTYILFANKPNPFNQITEIRYGLPNQTRIRIVVYNSSGQIITTLLNGIQNQGWYSVRWNGRDNKGKVCPSGIYFYRLVTDEYQTTRKMLMLK